jgi:transposase
VSAVRLVAESKADYGSEFEAIKSIASKLGIGSAETLRKWVRRAQIDAGQRPGVITEESEQQKTLKKELFDPAKVTTTRYRYRGSVISSPWPATDEEPHHTTRSGLVESPVH